MKILTFILLFYSLTAHALDLKKLEKVRAQYNLPSLGGLAIEHGKVVSSGVVGTRKIKGKVKATIKDKYHIGSCTKAMTATLVGIFVEDRKIKWTSTLEEIFKDELSIHTDYKKVTIEMLLAHRGGTPASTGRFQGGDLWRRLWNPNLNVSKGRIMLTKEILAAKPETTPGSKKVYSNSGYVIVGAALEKISGKSWENLMRSKLFSPLEMTSCGFLAPGKATGKPDQPWPHETTPEGPKPMAPGFMADNPPSTGPAGTVHCSLADWSKFVAAHIKGFNGQDNLLKAKTYQKLHTSYPGQKYTYGGWGRTKRNWANGPVLTHAGSNTLNYAVTWVAPKKNQAFFAVTNYAGPGARKSADDVIGLLMESLK